MHAIMQHRYGEPDALHYAETTVPSPKADEVLVRIQAASVNRGDVYMLRGQPFFVRFGSGLRRPKVKIPGADMAGVVEAVGREVSRFSPGDAVFGDLSGHGRGAFAEYVAAPAAVLAQKPAEISFAAAAAVPMAGVTALQGLRTHGRLRAGRRVLINGASGGVGTFAVQIAKALGAHVTAVCSTGKVELVAGLGADRVIDYRQEDFVRQSEQYDLIFDTVANRTVAEYRSALSADGVFVTTGFLPALAVPRMRFGRGKDRTMMNMLAKPNQGDLAFLASLLAAGTVKPVLDRLYPLTETAEALTYIDRGHAQGKVIISVGDDAPAAESRTDGSMVNEGFPVSAAILH